MFQCSKLESLLCDVVLVWQTTQRRAAVNCWWQKINDAVNGFR